MGENRNLDLLRLVGEALYGERWQAPIASDLGVSDRAVRYWLSKATPCPDDTGSRLLGIVVRKREALAHLEEQVRSRTSPAGTRP
ncbi:hypothetical protein [Sphingomonas corticis]|uniref:hypothetical protein n=1 Tax=Sphingomonas corticis TaxID=2722791 RepID=UPI001ADDDA7F|nr:hypothetical protein [Sphingomonas corticis]